MFLNYIKCEHKPTANFYFQDMLIS